jgi:two-component system phosphate regulon sensor histidine kinase PhoR
MNKKPNSLVLRIMLPFIVLIALTMAGLSMYLSSYIKSTYMELLETNLREETGLVADRISALIQQGESAETINERAVLYGRFLDTRVTIIAKDGSILGESYSDTREMENHLDRPEVQRALQNQASTEIRFSNTLMNEMLYSAAPIQGNGEILGVARLAVSLRSIQRNIRSLQSTLLIATSIATVLAVLLTFLVATYTVHPLKLLTETSRRIAEGNMEGIASTTRQDEIGQLHQAFQFMAYRLKEQIGALQAERSKLEAVLSNMMDGIVIVDPQGTVQLVNPAALRMFNRQDEVPRGKSLVEVVRHHQLVELWRRCLLSGEQQTITLETTPDRLFIQGIATPLEDALPGMILMVFQDLTRVRKLETVRRDFVSNVSHDLRTPLASLKALTETLQASALEDPPAARRFLQRMDTEIDTLTQMVQELLELTRIESNRFPMQRLQIKPCAIVTPAVERMQLQADRAGLSLRMECMTGLPPVNADPSRIEQVLTNLIHNAIKFTPPGGEIVISARQDGNNVLFSIQDTGVGITPELLPRIFERFYKADRARSGGGTGLGLSIARHTIEAHGGRIWADSVVNQGSTFYFTLPVA